jgi:hypothetical protein
MSEDWTPEEIEKWEAPAKEFSAHAMLVAELLLAIARNFKNPGRGNRLATIRKRFDQAAEIMTAIDDAIRAEESKQGERPQPASDEAPEDFDLGHTQGVSE